MVANLVLAVVACTSVVAGGAWLMVFLNSRPRRRCPLCGSMCKHYAQGDYRCYACPTWFGRHYGIEGRFAQHDYVNDGAFRSRCC